MKAGSGQIPAIVPSPAAPRTGGWFWWSWWSALLDFKNSFDHHMNGLITIVQGSHTSKIQYSAKNPHGPSLFFLPALLGEPNFCIKISICWSNILSERLKHTTTYKTYNNSVNFSRTMDLSFIKEQPMNCFWSRNRHFCLKNKYFTFNKFPFLVIHQPC